MAWLPPFCIEAAATGMVSPSSTTANEAQRRRAEDEKRAEALLEEEARVRNDPKLWRRG
jgi:hypothetical protein